MVWKIWNHSLPFPWIKKKAAEYGYTVAQVYQLVSAKMADSKSATTISTDIKDYKVYVQTQEQTDTKLDDIRQMTFTHTDKDGKEKRDSSYENL